MLIPAPQILWNVVADCGDCAEKPTDDCPSCDGTGVIHVCGGCLEPLPPGTRDAACGACLRLADETTRYDCSTSSDSFVA